MAKSETQGASLTTAAQFAYESMKGWILSGYLMPGERIDQDDAARKMNLSRMPLRSGLDRLAMEGLVVKTPHRGVIVTPVSAADLNSIFNLRAQLEAMAIIELTRIVTDESIAQLYAVLQLQESLQNPRLSDILEQNRSFHRCLAQLSKDDVLIRSLDGLWERCERYRRIYFEGLNANDRIQQEHRRLVDLIAKRDAQSAADCLIEHTRRSQEALLQRFDETLPPLVYKPVAL